MENKMDKCKGSCKLIEFMYAEILETIKDKPEEETKWFDLLLSTKGESKDHPLCCILAFLTYYGYCKEITTPLSEYARQMVSSLQKSQ